MVSGLLSSPPAELVEGSYALRVLQTVGCRSGRPRRTPVGVLRRDGCSYLVCPERSRDWAQNLLADPSCVVEAGSAQDRHWAVAVGGAEAVESISAYLTVVDAPWALAAFGLGENPGREQIAAALPRMAVFRLESGRADGVDSA